jgi:signal transduction histidine kinase/AraC-like DNA-binding protein
MKKCNTMRHCSIINKYSLFYVFLSLATTLLLSSCVTKTDAKKFRIGFSQCTGNDLWRQTMMEEMKRELSFHNNIEFIYRDAGGNSQKQVAQIEELAKQNIDILIVSPNELQPLSSEIQKVYEAGLRVVVVDRRIVSENYTAFIGASNFEVGQNAGRYAASLLKGKGNVIEVTGLPGASPVIDRHNGFMDIISHYPSIKYLKKLDDNSKPFNEVEEETIKSTKNLDLIFAQNDFMAYDAYKICKKLGLEKRIKIIGIDGLAVKDGGLDMVANKYISATVLYPTGGQEAIITAINILENKPFKKENQLVTTIIDSSNVRIMKLQSEKVISQQKDIEARQKLIDQQLLITQNQSTVIFMITLALTITLVFGGITFYYLRENKKITNQLEKQNKEISEQKNQLVIMSQKAEDAHQAKLNFFTNISHEFRTPLTLILSPLEELLTNTKLPISYKQTLQLVQKNVIRLYKLVNQLMDFRKIELEKMQLRASNNDLIAFTKEIVASYEVLAKNKNINLQFFTSEVKLPVWFDVSMIDKVIFNLLSNAFKFTKENGFIHVSISKENEKAVIKVEDSGIGMSPETIAHAFEPFFQGEYENYKGTGLGLALSRELIGIHHGTITVKSEKWKGTLFEVELPLGNAHLSENEMIAESETTNLISEDARIYITELYDNNKYDEESEPGNTQKDYSILIIEDNDDLRLYLQAQLAKKYDVLVAENSNLALQQVFDNLPDLVICDVVIPGKNGLEVTKILKSDVRTAHIPIVLLTARSEDNQKIEGLKTGADAYMTKPFNIQYLQQTMESLLQNREKTKVHYSSEILVEEKSQVSKKTDRKFISEFTAIVEKNIANEKFGVEDICSELLMSRIALYRKVKAVMNCNVNDYIITTRLQKAKYYLQHEELSIAEVAFKTGFSSPAYFSTVFKSKLGVSPASFKKEH